MTYPVLFYVADIRGASQNGLYLFVAAIVVADEGGATVIEDLLGLSLARISSLSCRPLPGYAWGKRLERNWWLVR